MSEPVAAVQTMNVSTARQEWADVINRVHQGEVRVLLEEGGIPMAAVVSAEDLQRLLRFEEERAERGRVLDRVSMPFRNIPVEELEREVEQAVAETRAEYRPTPRTSE